MYRRYRTIDLLKDEYGKLLDQNADDVPALIVMGRLQHTTGDDARALELFQRAVARKDDDAQAWLLIGELQKAREQAQGRARGLRQGAGPRGGRRT